MKRTVVILLILIGIVISLSALGWLFYDQRLANPASESVPDALVDLPLTNRMIGSQASFDFIQMHGKQFPLTSGAVGIYGDGQATLWVAGAPFKSMARDMVIAMRDKIAQGRSSFTPTGESSADGRTVYSLEGMGQKHFYFQSGNLVIWLAIEPDLADTALQQLKEYYP